MKKKFYRRKRLWLLIFLTPFLLFAVYLASNPLVNFRKSVNFLLRQMDIEEHYLRLDGGVAHYYETGRENPRTVILLHGFGGNAMLTWMRLIPSLKEKYHVIAPDMLASNFLKLSPKDYSLLSEVEFVLALMQQLQIEQADLVGLSVGGWVSLTIALDHPEKVGKLILVESAGLRTEIPEFARLTLHDRESTQKFLGTLFYKPPPLPGFVLDELVKSSQRIQKKYQEVLMGFIRNSEPLLLDERLGEIRQPTLLIHGEDDQVIPVEVARRMHRLIPDSKLVILKESGHAPVWDQPERLEEEILNFLDSN